MAEIIGYVRVYEILDEFNGTPLWTGAPTYGTTYHDIPVLDSNPSADQCAAPYLNTEAIENICLGIKLDSGTALGFYLESHDSYTNSAGYYSQMRFWMRDVPYDSTAGNNSTSSDGIRGDSTRTSDRSYVGVYARMVDSYGLRFGYVKYDASDATYSAGTYLNDTGPYVDFTAYQPEEEEPTTASVYLKSLLMGWLVGRILAGQRG